MEERNNIIKLEKKKKKNQVQKSNGNHLKKLFRTILFKLADREDLDFRRKLEEFRGLESMQNNIGFYLEFLFQKSLNITDSKA